MYRIWKINRVGARTRFEIGVVCKGWVSSTPLSASTTHVVRHEGQYLINKTQHRERTLEARVEGNMESDPDKRAGAALKTV